MSFTFLGQIMMTGFDYAPTGFARCDGQLLSIAQNQALFALLGTQYGGDGVTTFALPDLRGRTPVGYAPSVDPGWQPPAVQLGERSGRETVTLSVSEVPPHTHTLTGSSARATSADPTNRTFAVRRSGAGFASSPNAISAQVEPSGGNQPHPNMQPYTVVNFCIALEGIFPSRN